MSFTSSLKSWIFSDAASQFVMGMLGALVVLMIVNFVPPFEKPRIATVDITGIANRFVTQEAKQNLPADILKKRVNAFGQALEKSVNQVAKQNSLILVPKEAVMAGAKDVTELVEKDVQASLQISKEA
jgi:hypothetical protein